jgi:hypothetical protein
VWHDHVNLTMAVTFEVRARFQRRPFRHPRIATNLCDPGHPMR